jgi:DNA (cytosine-5)-methyltransferase 1
VKIRVLDLFSGIGGFHLGLTRAGFEVESYFSEIDKYAIDVYSNNFKDATYVGSVTDVRGADLTRIDAITFGSPCQDFSLAGKRKGLGGDRSSLIGEAIRLISECRPRFFIWENVKGTFSSNDGADFWAIIQAFTNIGGYRLEWQLLNTKWFLPQNRERIYLVGYIGDGSRGQVFPIGEDNGANNELSRQQGNICTLTTRYGADGNGSYITERKLDAQKVKVNSATNAGYEEATIGDSINLSVPTSKTRRGRVGKGVAQTLDTHCNQAVIQVNNSKESGEKQPYQQNRIYDANGISPALLRDKSDLIIKTQIVNRIRRLTPIECERLQGFPDNWTKYGQGGEMSDSQRYKMCGNAVTVDVVKEVAKRIKTII